MCVMKINTLPYRHLYRCFCNIKIPKSTASVVGVYFIDF